MARNKQDLFSGLSLPVCQTPWYFWQYYEKCYCKCSQADNFSIVFQYLTSQDAFSMQLTVFLTILVYKWRCKCSVFESHCTSWVEMPGKLSEIRIQGFGVWIPRKIMWKSVAVIFLKIVNGSSCLYTCVTGDDFLKEEFHYQGLNYSPLNSQGYQNINIHI